MTFRIEVEPPRIPECASSEAPERATFTELIPRTQGAVVLVAYFPPGAEAGGWHVHDRGQYLESVSGRGWVLEAGREPLPLEPGDRVWCPPGSVHRHGAYAAGDWVQFSITPGGTEWLGGGDPRIPDGGAAALPPNTRDE